MRLLSIGILHYRFLKSISVLTMLVLVAMVPPSAVSASQSDGKKGKVTVQWLGHAAFKITSVKGKVIIIDPFITKNPKTPSFLKDLAQGRLNSDYTWAR